METFFAEYSKQLERAVVEHPDEYTFPASSLCNVLGKMYGAIKAGTFNKDGRAFANTCKRLKIKHTYKAIQHFIANHV